MLKNTFYCLLFSLFCALFLTNCTNQDPCLKNNIECKNGGACSDGKCLCANAFEGALCENRITKPFVGIYNGTEVDTASKTVRLTVSESKVAVDRIALKLPSFSAYEARVKADGSFVILEQLLLNQSDTIRTKSDTIYVSGEGKRTNNELNYTIYYGTQIDSTKTGWLSRRAIGKVLR